MFFMKQKISFPVLILKVGFNYTYSMVNPVYAHRKLRRPNSPTGASPILCTIVDQGMKNLT
jgi:hypothetical protein